MEDYLVTWSGDWHQGGFGGYLNVIAEETRDAPALDPYQHVKLAGRRMSETPEQRRVRRLSHQRKSRAIIPAAFPGEGHRCTSCQQVKGRDHFSKNASRPDGFASSCRACHVIERAKAKVQGTWSGL